MASKKPVPPTVTVKPKDSGGLAWLVRVDGVVSSVHSYEPQDAEGERRAYREALRHKDAVLADWRARQRVQP
jgi:hypothetical protein